MLNPPAIGASALLLCLLATAARADDEEATGRPLKTAIKEVVVYADRAQVTRSGTIDLNARPGQWVVTGLPGWIDAESVRATVSPATAGRIVDVSVERTFLVKSSEEAVAKAEAALREVQDQLAALSDEERVIAAEIQQLESIRAFSLEKLPRDMVTRDVKVKTFAETVDFVSESLRENREKLRTLAAKKRDLEPERQARTATLRELSARSKLEQSSILIEATGQGRATVELSYLTPGATWEPLGELRVTGDGNRVSLVQFANVVQTTGEDWEGATLSFATQRPDEALGIPQVQALLVGAGGAGLDEAVRRKDESFKRASSSYTTQNAIVAQTRSDWALNMSNQMEVQQRAAATFNQLASRGTTSHFQAIGPRTVRASGRPVRVPIATSDFEGTVQVVAVPEVSLNAVRTVALRNTSDLPVLPGRFSLFVDGAFVGTSSFDFVAPGETFSAFLGVHERIKLSRQIDRKRSSIDRGKKRTTAKVSFVIEAENLSDFPTVIDLGDRVPVAQMAEIEIEDVKVPDGARRDADGVVKWTATIPPRKKVSWRISYEMEYPNDLVSRGRAMPAAPKAQQKLYEDVERLEKSL